MFYVKSESQNLLCVQSPLSSRCVIATTVYLYSGMKKNMISILKSVLITVASFQKSYFFFVFTPLFRKIETLTFMKFLFFDKKFLNFVKIL